MSYIKIWNFYDAPEEFRKLSDNGGDEDYIAHLPKELVEQFRYCNFSFLESDSFGCCSINEYPLKDGSLILIGCHA